MRMNVNELVSLYCLTFSFSATTDHSVLCLITYSVVGSTLELFVD
jgi:hypothetical protein